MTVCFSQSPRSLQLSTEGTKEVDREPEIVDESTELSSLSVARAISSESIDGTTSRDNCGDSNDCPKQPRLSNAFYSLRAVIDDSDWSTPSANRRNHVVPTIRFSIFEQNHRPVRRRLISGSPSTKVDYNAKQTNVLRKPSSSIVCFPMLKAELHLKA